MKILCLTDFRDESSSDRWLLDYVDAPTDEIDFLGVNLRDRSARWGKFLTRYPAMLRLAWRALRRTREKEYDLVIAWEGKAGVPFALLRRLARRSQPPFLILTFTPGNLPAIFYPGIRFALGSVDHVSVLTRAEIAGYGRLFGLPPTKISVCLLGAYDVRPRSTPRAAEGDVYIHASGRSARDYATLIRAVDGLEVKTLIHGRGYSFAGLNLPVNVEVGEMVPFGEYVRLVAHAQFEVVPLQDRLLPTGSSQIVFAMMMGKAVVATRTASTVDYIEPGVTGLLVEPGDVEGLRTAIKYLLAHPDEAQAMGRVARQRYEHEYTYPAFARRAYQIMRTVAEGGAAA